jgi:hypothetical protein
MRTVREISFLTDLPDDLQFVLALHEAFVVGWPPASRRSPNGLRW